MLKGKLSYQMEAVSQASESSHTIIISRPERDVVTHRPMPQGCSRVRSDRAKTGEIRRPHSTLSFLISNPPTTRPVRSLDGCPGAKRGLHLDRIVGHKVVLPSCVEGYSASGNCSAECSYATASLLAWYNNFRFLPVRPLRLSANGRAKGIRVTPSSPALPAKC
jgi:hypothetical protein